MSERHEKNAARAWDVVQIHEDTRGGKYVLNIGESSCHVQTIPPPHHYSSREQRTVRDRDRGCSAVLGMGDLSTVHIYTSIYVFS